MKAGEEGRAGEGGGGDWIRLRAVLTGMVEPPGMSAWDEANQVERDEYIFRLLTLLKGNFKACVYSHCSKEFLIHNRRAASVK